MALLLAGCSGAGSESAQPPESSGGVAHVVVPAPPESASEEDTHGEGTEHQRSTVTEARATGIYVEATPMTTDPRVMRQAAAQFQRADAGFAQYAMLAIHIPRPANLSAYIQSLRVQVMQHSQAAQALHSDYEAVQEFHTAHWSVAALSQQGRVQEVLADAIRTINVPFVLPAAVQQQLAGQQIGAATRAQLHAQITSTVQQVLDALSRPMQCLALVRYVKAVRLARVASPGGPMVNEPHSKFALGRLNAVPHATLEDCMREARTQDPSLRPIAPGEFRP
ncbi:MAG: hypothetical protein AB8H86_26800 [Polyangiales bacterium]